MYSSKLGILALTLGIVFALPVFAHNSNPAGKPEIDGREVSAPVGVKIAKLRTNKWCCHFTDVLGHHKNVTVQTGILAVSACWGAAVGLFPAIISVQVSKGSC